MLGQGRPFVLQLVDAHNASPSAQDFRQVEASLTAVRSQHHPCPDHPLLCLLIQVARICIHRKMLVAMELDRGH